MIFAGWLSSGFQNIVSLIQHASLSTRSLKPKAWNISIVRHAMPSACPRSIRHPRRSAAHDQDIDLFGEGALCARGSISFRRIEYFRVTRLETIEMKLHADPAQVQFM